MTLHAESFYELVQKPKWNRPVDFDTQCTSEISHFVKCPSSFQVTLTDLAASNTSAEVPRRVNATLELRRVISAQRQVVAGTRYVVTAPIGAIIKTSVIILEDIRGVIVEASIDTEDVLLDSDMQDVIDDTFQVACDLDPAGAQAAGQCLGS